VSSGIPGVDVASAQDGSWDSHRLASSWLAAKSFHVWADVYGLTYHLHRPMNYR
jgi:hypothetical protein